MSFSEERLDLGIDYGTVATLTTKTTIIEEGGGGEQRTIDWEQPMLKFAIGQIGALNDELEYFIEFHRERKGAYEGFRFKDWSDWRGENQAIGTGDGVKTQFQLFKTYSVAGQTVKRPITKPVAGTVTVRVAGTVTSATVNTATGVITFASAPTGPITADFEFDVPVRFESDEIKLRFEAFEPATGRKIFNWEGLTLVEVRVPAGVPLPIDSIPQSLDHTIDLGYDYGTIGGNKFETRIDKLVSGHENRASNWENPKGTWEIGQRTLDLSELDYLIVLFRLCRGRAIAFRYFDRSEMVYRNVRFGEEAISFRFDAYEAGTGRVIFYLSGVALMAIVPIGPSVPLVLSNTGYGMGWDRPVSTNSYGWNGAGDSNSKWLTYPEPAPAKTGDNFDWVVRYSVTSLGYYALRARFMVDNQLMAVTVNGFEYYRGPFGGFDSGWTEIELFVPPGAIVIAFTVRNVAPGEPTGFQTFNPTGFRLEWI